MNRTNLSTLACVCLLAVTSLAGGCAADGDRGDTDPSVFASPTVGPSTEPTMPPALPAPSPTAGSPAPVSPPPPTPIGPGPAAPTPALGADSGVASDAGPVVDAGTHSDAGNQADAGTDAGTPTTVAQSPGCGITVNDAKGSWSKRGVPIGNASRSYDVHLPKTYDAQTAYPLILLLHGCGSPTNNVPMEQVAGDDAIVVRGAGTKNGCWYDTASGADLPYLDALLDDVQASFCVHPDHLFAVGYSSGSWLANTLSCHRGDVFRGIATVTGGEPGEISQCVGQHGRIYIHDTTDNDNRIAWDTPSRDRMLRTNHCSDNTQPVDPSPCVEYQGCDPGYPVVWCQTTGQGHNRQDNLARPAFWAFFQRLMQE